MAKCKTVPYNLWPSQAVFEVAGQWTKAEFLWALEDSHCFHQLLGQSRCFIELAGE